MGLLDTIKGYAFESEQTSPVPQTKVAAATPPPTFDSPRMPPANYSIPVGGVVATVNQDVLTKLTGKVLAAAPEKYRSFQAMLDKFHQVAGMTSSAAYQAAQLATGITLVEINQAIADMLDRLTQEESSYSNNVISSAMQTQVTNRQNQVDLLKKKIEDNNRRLGELRVEITNSENEIMALERDMREAQLGIQSGEATFKSTVAFARTQLERAKAEAIQNLPQGAK